MKFVLTPLIRAIRKVYRKLDYKQAKTLNQQLYQEVLEIDQKEIEQLGKDIRQYAQHREYEVEYTQSFFAHRYRIYLSIKWLEQIIASLGSNLEISSLQGLEVGEETVITDLLTRSFPQVCWRNTIGDLRFPWENNDDSVDIIVSMEVTEHLADLPDGINHSFLFTGLKAYLHEAYRVLKPGGILFITTPNSGSAYVLINALAGKPPWYFNKHVREYTLTEMQAYLEEIGFIIQRAKAIQCMMVDEKIDYTVLFQMLLGSLIYQDVQERGDDLFIIAVKPI
jgi:SAM-dependent methyltransferase